jgi:hypothetical protein
MSIMFHLKYQMAAGIDKLQAWMFEQPVIADQVIAGMEVCD